MKRMEKGMNLYDIHEGLWELYITDCRMKEATPSIKDFLIWCEEEGYELPEQVEL